MSLVGGRRKVNYLALCLLLGLCELAADGTAAAAQEINGRTIRLVTPTPAGGSQDLLTRLLASALADRLKTPVIVENRAGAGGAIGAQWVAKANPDGTTLLLGNPAIFTILPHLSSNLGFDPTNDFEPVGSVGSTFGILVVRADVGIRTMAELLARGKDPAGSPPFGSGGVGTGSHLAGELLNVRAKTNFVHVPYKGSAPMLNAMLGGETLFSFMNGIDALPYIQAGKVRALATLSAQRTRLMPDVPTMAEAGLQNMSMDSWYVLFAPAKTPSGTVGLLREALREVMRSPDVQARLKELFISVEWMSPAGIAARIAAESARSAEAIAAAGVQKQ